MTRCAGSSDAMASWGDDARGEVLLRRDSQAWILPNSSEIILGLMWFRWNALKSIESLWFHIASCHRIVTLGCYYMSNSEMLIKMVETNWIAERLQPYMEENKARQTFRSQKDNRWPWLIWTTAPGNAGRTIHSYYSLKRTFWRQVIMYVTFVNEGEARNLDDILYIDS